MKRKKICLGVNIDHVATLREARRGNDPDLFQAAREAVRGGADGITVHLREDRRHIQPSDVLGLKRLLKRTPLNLEMAVDSRIVRFALKVRPEKVCWVPEKRREVTTEGGLDVAAKSAVIKRLMPRFKRKGIEVSLFIDPDVGQIMSSWSVGASAVEIHTGAYANAKGPRKERELERIRKAVRLVCALGMKANAGHGLNYQNVGPVARIPGIGELNIGHAVVSRALSVGLESAVREMRRKMRGA